jgi:hypothetical protein
MGNCIKRNILVIIAFTFIGIGFAFPYIIKLKYGKGGFTGLGTIGDWFGGLANPIIGVASFLLVYAAFKLQQEQSKEQNRTLGLQRFETTFFQLLTFHHSITEKLKISFKPVKKVSLKPIDIDDAAEDEEIILNQTEVYLEGAGRDFFSVAVKILKIYYEIEIAKSKEKNLQTKEKAMIDSYSKFYNEHQDSLGHYFRNLYHIAKYVDNTKLIENDEKKTYLGIYRAQLSAYEQILLLYNCCVQDLGYPKFRNLVINHDLLQNMNIDLLLDSDHYSIFKNLQYV